MGHFECVQVLLAAGAVVKTWGRDKTTPFHRAAFDRSDKILKILLERLGKGDPFINAKSSDNSTALHFASARGGIECVKLLLEYGADPEIANQMGETPADSASRANQNQVLEVLNPYLVFIFFFFFLGNSSSKKTKTETAAT